MKIDGVITSSTLLDSVVVWSQQNYPRCWKPWGISSPKAAAPSTILRGKAGMTVNEIDPSLGN